MEVSHEIEKGEKGGVGVAEQGGGIMPHSAHSTPIF